MKSIATNELPAEFALVVACCRWPASDARDVRVEALARRALDWPLFLRIVDRHRVAGLVGKALLDAAGAVPAAVTAALATRASVIARDNLKLAARSIQLKRDFSRAGVPLIFLKGTALAQMAYGTLGLKSAWDIDILVSPDHLDTAMDLLRRAGFEREIPAADVPDETLRLWIALSKETLWIRSADSIPVELHTQLVDNDLLLSGVGAHSPTIDVAIGGAETLPTLALEELYSYLCVHGATHAWSRLKWVVDVAALLSHRSAVDLVRLHDAAVRHGAGRCSGQALLLCSRLFDTPVPADLLTRIRCDPMIPRLERIALQTMLAGDAAAEVDAVRFAPERLFASHFLLQGGAHYFWSELKRKSRNPVDRTEIALPTSLHFLYPLIVVPRWFWRRARRA